MQIGAPHMRRRCYIQITKDISKLRHISPPYFDIWELQHVQNMVRTESKNQIYIFKKRYSLCGNSVVPACVTSTFSFLVHGNKYQMFAGNLK